MAAIIWCIPWVIFAQSDPKSHRWISKEEVDYITKNSRKNETKDRKSVPWLAIVTSKAVLAVIAVKVLKGWTIGVISMKLPAYLESVIHFAIDEV